MLNHVRTGKRRAHISLDYNLHLSQLTNHTSRITHAPIPKATLYSGLIALQLQGTPIEGVDGELGF